MFKLGDLVISASGPGSLTAYGEVALADLSVSVIEADDSVLSLLVPAIAPAGIAILLAALGATAYWRLRESGSVA